MKLEDIIKELEAIDKTCKSAKYSLDTVSDLLKLSKELKIQAIQVNQCCY